MNEQKEKNQLKFGFFKKVWYSITKIEKYADMASTGAFKAVIYISKLIAILAIIIGIGMMFQIYKILDEGVNYLQNEFPEFTYENGKLNIETEQKIEIPENNSYVGKTIIDTKTEDERVINQYINEISKNGRGMIILKNNVIFKNTAMAGTINYNYNQVLSQMKITRFTTQSVVEYAKSPKIINLYLSIFITIFIYSIR